jgi:hypothetical protein
VDGDRNKWESQLEFALGLRTPHPVFIDSSGIVDRMEQPRVGIPARRDERLIDLFLRGYSSVTITSAYTCASSPPSSSGNHLDTLTLCPSSTCKLTNSGFDADDAAYVAGGSGGANYITMNLSGAPTGFQYEEFGEIEPPLCGGSPCTTNADNGGGNGSTAFFNGACNPCTGPAFSVSATDGIIEIIDTNLAVNVPSANYPLDFIGNVFSFDNTTETAISFNTANSFSLTGVAFKSSGGSFAAPAKPFSQLYLGSPASISAQGSCTPTCPAVTLPFTTTSTGKLIMVMAQVLPGATQATISSITDNQGETWTIPSGASTCKQTGGTIDLSCAYVITTTTGSVSTFTATMSANTTAQFMFYGVGASSGTIALDAQNSSTTSGSNTIVTGQTLSLSGGTSGMVDVCFAEMGWAGTGTSPVEVAAYLYMAPQGANFFGGFSGNDANGGSMISLNQRNGNPPKMMLSSAATSQESSGICFHN